MNIIIGRRQRKKRSRASSYCISRTISANESETARDARTNEGIGSMLADVKATIWPDVIRMANCHLSVEYVKLKNP